MRLNDKYLLAFLELKLLAPLLATCVSDTHSHLGLLYFIRITVINIHHSVVHWWLLKQSVLVIKPAVRRRVVKSLIFKVNQSGRRCFGKTLRLFLCIVNFHEVLRYSRCIADCRFICNVFFTWAEGVLKLVIFMWHFSLDLHSFVNTNFSVVFRCDAASLVVWMMLQDESFHGRYVYHWLIWLQLAVWGLQPEVAPNWLVHNLLVLLFYYFG